MQEAVAFSLWLAWQARQLMAVVTGSCDGSSFRLAGRVALVAERLALVGADFYSARAVGKFRESKLADGEVHLLAAIKDG